MKKKGFFFIKRVRLIAKHNNDKSCSTDIFFLLLEPTEKSVFCVNRKSDFYYFVENEF